MDEQRLIDRLLYVLAVGRHGLGQHPLGFIFSITPTFLTTKAINNPDSINIPSALSPIYLIVQLRDDSKFPINPISGRI